MRVPGALLLLALAGPARAESVEVTPPQVQVYESLGEPSRFTVRGRALERTGERGSSILRRNVSRLLRSEPMAGVEVVVEVAGQRLTVRTDAEGMFEASFDLGPKALPRGPHPVVVRAGKVKGDGILRVVQPGDLVVVSDFDDTVAKTFVTSTRALLTSALLLDEKTQPKVEGMPELYQCLKGAPGNATFLYLSGSPVQYYPRVQTFLAHNGLPQGAIHLRQLGTGTVDPLGYKREALNRMLRDLPRQRYLFIGDSGEKDPEVYAATAPAAGERLLGTYIRLVTPEGPASVRFKGQLAFPQPGRAAEELVEKGLVTKECALTVKAAVEAVEAGDGGTPDASQGPGNPGPGPGGADGGVKL